MRATQNLYQDQAAFATFLSNRDGFTRVLSPAATPTLTQSGLLAVLFARQRYRANQLAWRRSRRTKCERCSGEHLKRRFHRGTIENGNIGLQRLVPGSAPSNVTEFVIRVPADPQLHGTNPTDSRRYSCTTSRLIQPNGDCPECDKHEARLKELLEAVTRNKPSSILFLALKSIAQIGKHDLIRDEC